MELQIDYRRARDQAASPTRSARKILPLRGAKLCRRCSKIDLDAVFARKHPSVCGKPVKDMSRLTKWSIRSCSLCALLAAILPSTAFKNPDERWVLRSFSSSMVHNIGWKKSDIVMIGFGRRGTGFDVLVPQPQNTEPVRRIKEDWINLEHIVVDWIRFCRDMHTKVCSIKTISPVPFFKLIDCQTRHIVSVPVLDRPYVTLSYMWGSQTERIEFSWILPENLPLTIDDSITVTRRLGFRYLWVDRYCINQQNAEEVEKQVGRMDIIYQMSEITIIASAGEDPSFGLPGISSRKRKDQAYGNVGKHVLISTLGDPRPLLERSKWRSRGWTYQEALLSRRRLVFTEEQVYFECYGMYCFETLDFPLEDLHTVDLQRFRHEYRNGRGVGIFPKGVGTDGWAITTRIQEYSQKSLTDSSDILKGIMGVLRVFETSKPAVHHLCGVPILPRPRLRQTQVDEMDGSSSSWVSTAGILCGLSWTLKKPSARRPGFPSWSWTGWFGHVSWQQIGQHSRRSASPQAYADMNVHIELRNGQIMEIDDLQQTNELDPQPAELSDFLHIEGWTSLLQDVERVSDKHELIFRTSIQLEDGGMIRCKFPLTTTQNPLPTQCIGIHIVQEDSEHRNFHDPMGPTLLIVGEVAGRMERIGFGPIEQFGSRIYSKDGICKWPVADESGMEFLWVNPMYEELLPRLNLVKSWTKTRLG